MIGLDCLVRDALDDAGVLLTPQRQEQLRLDAFAEGRRLLPHALGRDASALLRPAAASLELADAALARLLGFGWQQTRGLAMLAGTPADSQAEVAHLGALFNLGVVLFDRILDRFPWRASQLYRLITPEFLETHLRGTSTELPASGDVAVDALGALVVEYLARCRQLGGDSRDRLAFGFLLRQMYVAEREAGSQLREGAPPTMAVWRGLRRKSALPLAMMARIALLPKPHGPGERRSAALASVRLAGRAIWILDDLADVREDWTQGGWSRPLWWLARVEGQPASASAAQRRVVESNFAVGEARRLVLALRQLRALADEYGSSFARSFLAAVHAWLEELSD